MSGVCKQSHISRISGKGKLFFKQANLRGVFVQIIDCFQFFKNRVRDKRVSKEKRRERAYNPSPSWSARSALSPPPMSQHGKRLPLHTRKFVVPRGWYQQRNETPYFFHQARLPAFVASFLSRAQARSSPRRYRPGNPWQHNCQGIRRILCAFLTSTAHDNAASTFFIISHVNITIFGDCKDNMRVVKRDSAPLGKHVWTKAAIWPCGAERERWQTPNTPTNWHGGPRCVSPTAGGLPNNIVRDKR